MTKATLILLLCLPVEVPLPPEADAATWKALKDLARDLELWDRDEHWGPDFGADFRWVYRTWREVHDAPPAADVLRFPPADVALACWRFNFAYQEHLEARLATAATGHDEIRTALTEARSLGEVWDLAYTAARGTPGLSIAGQRRGLKALREAIGPEAYYAGRLPPHVPVWRFGQLPPGTRELPEPLPPPTESSGDW